MSRNEFYLMKFGNFLENRACITDWSVLLLFQGTIPRIPFRGWFGAGINSNFCRLPRRWHVFGIGDLAAATWRLVVVLAFVLRLKRKSILYLYGSLLRYFLSMRSWQNYGYQCVKKFNIQTFISNFIALSKV